MYYKIAFSRGRSFSKGGESHRLTWQTSEEIEGRGDLQVKEGMFVTTMTRKRSDVMVKLICAVVENTIGKRTSRANMLDPL